MFKYGDLVTVKGHDMTFKIVKCSISGRFVVEGLNDPSARTTLRKSDLIKVGETDFGKHPFKKFYENGLKPSTLPAHTYKGRLVDWLRHKVDILGFKPEHIFDLEFFWPNVEPSDTDFIYFWPNSDARLKGKSGRAKTKPGKFFKKLFPMISDKEVESLVEKFKKDFAPVDCSVFEGSSREDFLRAYTGERAPDRNFETTSKYKRMCDSCMRYERDYFETEIHPVEVFATGDWKIIWVEDDNKLVVARVTCYIGEDGLELGPIYSTCQEGIEKLEEHLEGLEHSGVGEGNWEGARVEKYEQDGKLVGPYFDQACDLRESSCGKYLVIDSCGNIEHHHDGFYEIGKVCTCCNGMEPETTYVESCDGEVCSHCLQSTLFISDFDQEYYHDDDHVEVYIFRGVSESWTRHQADHHATYCEEAGEYYRDDKVVEAYDGDYIPKWYIEDGDWFICSVDGLAYEASEMVGTKLGPVAKENYEEEVA